MISVRKADKLIPVMDNNLEFKKRGVTKDIISVMMWANDLADKYTAPYAATLQVCTIADLYAIWLLVRNNIKYVADEVGKEVIKSPSALWHLRKTEGGDCKSFSLFIKSICSNLGFQGGYRFVSWQVDEPITHVYPYVIFQGQKCFLDAVPGAHFNAEAPYATYVDYDWHNKTMIAGIGPTQSKQGPSIFKIIVVAGLTYCVFSNIAK